MIDQAMVALRSLSANPETRSAAMSREEALMLYQMDIDAANEQGIQKGFEKGIEKGIEKGFEKGFEKGRMQTLAYAVICVLASKGADVTQQLRDIIEGCGDADRLDRWLVRASTMNPGDVFHAD